MEKVTINQLNNTIARKQPALKYSEESSDIKIKVEAEEPSMLEMRHCITSNDYQELVDVKDEIEIGDILLLDGNNFVNNIVEFDIDKGFSPSKKDEEDGNENESSDGMNETEIDQLTHMAVDDKSMNYKCAYCNYTSKRSANIKKHFADTHKKIKCYKCQHCDFISYSPEGIKKHIDGVHIKNHKCPHCDYAARFPSTMKRHIQTVHERIKNKCEQCDYTASDSYKIRKHFEAVHEKLKKYKCLYCDYSANIWEALHRHIMVVHQKIKNYEYVQLTTPRVSNGFQEFVDLKHEIEIGDILLLDGNNFVDNIVKFDIDTSRINSDNNSENDEKDGNQNESSDGMNETKMDDFTYMAIDDKTTTNYRCAYCNYTSINSGNIKKHFKDVHKKIRVHIKNYKCPCCDYTSRFSGVMRKHIRVIHEKNKKFKCGRCYYTASQACSIRKHFVEIHVTTKKYKRQ